MKTRFISGSFNRHIVVGFIVAVIYILIAMPICILGLRDGLLSMMGGWLTLPAWPFVRVLVWLFPPPQPHIGVSYLSYDYFILASQALIAGIIFGFIAGLLSRYVFPNRHVLPNNSPEPN